MKHSRQSSIEKLLVPFSAPPPRWNLIIFEALRTNCHQLRRESLQTAPARPDSRQLSLLDDSTFGRKNGPYRPSECGRFQCIWDCGSEEFPPPCDVDEDWEDRILRPPQENEIANGDDGPSDMMEISPITITQMKVAWQTLRVAFQQRCEFLSMIGPVDDYLSRISNEGMKQCNINDFFETTKRSVTSSPRGPHIIEIEDEDTEVATLP